MSIENTTKPAGKSVMALMIGVLIRPQATLAYLKDNHRRAWWLPAILIMLLTVAPVVVGSRSSSPEMGSPTAGAMISGVKGIAVEPQAMPGMETPPSTSTSGGPGLLTLGGAILGTPVAWLIWGGALSLASVFLGRSSSFGQMFRLTVWTWLPYGIRGLVQTVYILATGHPIVNAGLSGFVVDKSVSAIISPGPGQLALASILGRVDIYLIWHLLLVSVGLMAFTNLTRKKAWTAALAIWLVLTLLGIVPAIFGGMLGGILNGVMNTGAYG